MFFSIVFAMICETSLGQASGTDKRIEAIDKENNRSILASGGNINKAEVTPDGSIFIMARMDRDHRFFGYGKPDVKSERLILLSSFTDDVSDNPFRCRLGAFHDTNGMEEWLTLKYVSTSGNFVKAVVTDKDNKSTTVYFEKKWIQVN